MRGDLWSMTDQQKRTLTDDERRLLLTKIHLNAWPETGAALGVSRSFVYAKLRSGEIPSARIGGKILVPTSALRKMLGIEDVAATRAGPQSAAGVAEVALPLKRRPLSGEMVCLLSPGG